MEDSEREDGYEFLDDFTNEKLGVLLGESMTVLQEHTGRVIAICKRLTDRSTT